jgi:hypothetical protein
MKTLGFVAGCVLLMAPSVVAQENELWPARTFVTVDMPFQLLDNDFSESLSFPDALRRTENVTFFAGYEPVRGPLIDVGAGVRVTGRVGVGATASWFTRSASGSFDLKVPSPLAPNQPLALVGSTTGLTRNEVGVHIQALYVLLLGDEATVVLGGGPTLFTARQELIRSIEFDRLPGFTSLRLNDTLVTEVDKTAIGFNVSANVIWPIGSHFGVGAVTRYARATVTVDPGAETSVPRAIEMQLGGLHVGGGIRLLF